jgi:hypothetical protein
MIKKYIVLFVFMTQGLYLFATAQEPDVLIYNGKIILCNILTEDAKVTEL